MKKVITYGTYDLLHHGHIRLLERAKALGDYLIVGVTADSFDQARGKLNVEQSLMDRIEAVRATGLADEIIVEEYEGQKIDDIQRYGVDIFAIGSDWLGKFDYLKEYCEVVYLDRTQGISSTDLRAKEHQLRLGLVGESPIMNKFEHESQFVNGLTISGVCSDHTRHLSETLKQQAMPMSELDSLLSKSDAIYIISNTRYHYDHISRALEHGCHVLCESPITINSEQLKQLRAMAAERNLMLVDSLKTAYSMAYYRLILLAKSGIIGRVVSVDATCTSMANLEMSDEHDMNYLWNSIDAWGPTAMMPIFQLLGTDYCSKTVTTHLLEGRPDFDAFTKIAFVYPHAVASLKVGQGVKSEGSLVISGTKGYIYVPAPWWKTDYFEVRYENSAENRRHFYQLDGEGIRYMLVSFLKAIQTGRHINYLDQTVSDAIVKVISDFYRKEKIIFI
ncbi:MAG: adenylyltransferase/cytidyltransferase family protein [Bacteroidaceae bacterium]|nr:adenylyltransferase/cytidyltransferase family protein [Bacteroidaceae bacterium]